MPLHTAIVGEVNCRGRNRQMLTFSPKQVQMKIHGALSRSINKRASTRALARTNAYGQVPKQLGERFIFDLQIAPNAHIHRQWCGLFFAARRIPCAALTPPSVYSHIVSSCDCTYPSKWCTCVLGCALSLALMQEGAHPAHVLACTSFCAQCVCLCVRICMM